ncbi:hypothetical protein E4T43_09150 [Aureobasidium subglaciale]|nr:hypothetical protein E4T43_09150 [Aureobasidium subglaciale]
MQHRRPDASSNARTQLPPLAPRVCRWEYFLYAAETVTPFKGRLLVIPYSIPITRDLNNH